MIPYSLEANVKFYDSSIEMEPNNKIVDANVIKDNVINGKIYPTGDIDYYKYLPKENDSICRLEIIPPVGIDIKFDILNLSGETIYKIDNSPIGEPEIFPNVYSKNPFILKVYSTPVSSDVDMNYALSINERQSELEEETEPNDTQKSSDQVKRNVIKGYVSYDGDKDYYAIETGKRVRVLFSVSGIDDNVIDVSITDSLGYVIKTVTVESKEVVEIQEMIDIKGLIIEA